MTAEHVEVLIVGAGLSGIGAGVHLQTRCPSKRYAILEARNSIGGTWDLFRYPGVRSDSDMFTLGYEFRPWTRPRAIAEGPGILEYLRETAREHGIDRHIRFQHRVRTASWSSAQARWTVEAEVGPERIPVRLTCNFLYLCSGYYSYESGYRPAFPGSERFQGLLLHPQQWPADLDYSGKRVIVIGSGATAVTLVPAMARRAAHVTMLQRSPSYLLSQPAADRIAGLLQRVLPPRLAHRLIRSKNMLLSLAFYQFCRRAPRLAARVLRANVARQLPAGYPLDIHFQPRYRPWDQRLCLVPDADLFRAIRGGRASVVTGRIDTFTERGIRLQSGQELPADIVVTATGLQLLPLGGLRLTVDGAPVELNRTLSYRGLMLSGVPNLAVCFGYTNMSWTLRADLVSRYVCRLLRHMDRCGYDVCVPCNDDPAVTAQPLFGLTSGYIRRAIDAFPKQGSKAPWRVHQNYLLDLLSLRLSRLEDGCLRFSTTGEPTLLATQETG